MNAETKKTKGKAAIKQKESKGVSPYVIVFVLLTVITIVELYVSAMGISKGEQITLLMIMATAKALLVVMYYMHLRYESVVLRLIVVVPFALVLAFAYILMV
jgi:cytochrome c oxidase subunit 4